MLNPFFKMFNIPLSRIIDLSIGTMFRYPACSCVFLLQDHSSKSGCKRVRIVSVCQKHMDLGMSFSPGDYLDIANSTEVLVTNHEEEL